MRGSDTASGMNPFVNPKKRSILLPAGCKDLIDVLRPPQRAHSRTIERFICLVLWQAQQDKATTLTIGVAAESGETPIRYKVEGKWYDLAPLPSPHRPRLIAALLRMAQSSAVNFPCEGTLDVDFGGVRLRWKVKITSAEKECVLVPVRV